MDPGSLAKFSTGGATDPKGLANASVGLSTGGTYLSLFGNVLKGISGANMYGYQAGIARMKQQIAEQNAGYALYAGDKEAAIAGMRGAAQQGKIIAQQGASNIDVGKGSARQVQDSQHLITQMDMEQIRENAARKSYGYAVEAAGDKAQAKMYDRAAFFSLAQIPSDMASTLMTGSTSVASKWLQSRQYGIYGNNDVDNYSYGFG